MRYLIILYYEMFYALNASRNYSIQWSKENRNLKPTFFTRITLIILHHMLKKTKLIKTCYLFRYDKFYSNLIYFTRMINIFLQKNSKWYVVWNTSKNFMTWTSTRYSLSQMEKMVVVVSFACVYLYLENIYLKMINHYKRRERH